MNIDFDKIASLLERVTSGNAGEVYINFHPERKTCTITWKRPRGLLRHESWSSRIEVLLYVKDLLVNAGVGVTLRIEVAQEDFTPED